ncbi:MAG TPA: DinB family protein [Candidatus Dormibacteraeota bacterium]
MSRFLGLLNDLARFTDAEMARPWTWPGHAGEALQLRDLHWRIVEAEQAALVTAPVATTEPAAIMDLAQTALGDLRGLLTGLPGMLLDREPDSGEWTLREVLAHVLLVERRYLRQVRYAAERAETDPVYLRAPLELQEEERAGDVADWLERLEQSRAESDAYCSRLPLEALIRPTMWAGHEVDVRFRLHRFAAHLDEHRIHCQKVVRALGIEPTEAREIVRTLSGLRGSHERRTPREELDSLDARHLALAANA